MTQAYEPLPDREEEGMATSADDGGWVAVACAVLLILTAVLFIVALVHHFHPEPLRPQPCVQAVPQ